ncbi:MAG: molybdopterin cofactor-binding domain-containing protein [Planctomycetaceae bacterium]
MSSERFDDLTAEAERYELREAPAYSFETGRREFVQAMSAGVMIAICANPARGQRGGSRTARADEPLSTRFHFSEDGTVTVFTSKVEAGQGSRTQITQAAAEELRLPVDRVQLVMADTRRCPDDGGTAGSRTTPSTVPRVRNAAAAARELLTDYAAQRLNADRSELVIDNGVFRAGGSQVTLTELASDPVLQERLSTATPAGEVPITDVSEWSVLGTTAGKVGGRDVVTGRAKFPSDIIRPGMMYGRILRPVSYGATLKSVDLSAAGDMPDVTVVRDAGFVGCVAPSSWQAAKCIEAIARSAQWDEISSDTNSQNLFEHLKRTGRPDRRGTRVWGDFESAVKGADKSIERQYTIAYIQHAPMEPRAAVAEWDNGQLTVWTGTQQPARVHRELCETFRLPDDSVRVIVPDTGGGFGGKHTGEAAIEAARLAKSSGKPVHLRWTRDEEFTWAYFRPAGLIEVQAGIDAGGRLTGWDFANYNSGGSAIDTPYTAAAGRTRFIGADSPLRQGSYRALASTANTFARECAMDELAELAGIDPLEFRIRNLEDGRLKNVLKAAAERFQWPRRRNNIAAGHGVGLACGTEKGSFVAACAEVEIIDGKLNVVRICQAFECGAIQNPGNLKAQVEGCLIMGLGAALFEEIRFADGRILNPAFSGYRVPRMAEVPELEIVLVDRKDLPSVGAGETPIIAVAPAIANAIHQAAGVRSRSLPLRFAESRG